MSENYSRHNVKFTGIIKNQTAQSGAFKQNLDHYAQFLLIELIAPGQRYFYFPFVNEIERLEIAEKA